MDDKLYGDMLELQRELVDSCDVCGGAGYLTPENPGETNPCKCMTVHSYVCALMEARIPRDYWWLPLDSLEIEQTYKTFNKWFTDRLSVAVQNSMGILYMGTNGVGKTSLQCIIGKEAVVQGYSVRYYTAQQYLEATKAKNKELLADLESPQVILLDELDKVYISQSSDYAKRTLEDYLRRMTSGDRVLVICTNGDPEYIAKMYGDSTISALTRHLKYVTVKGDDYSEKLQDRWNQVMNSTHEWYDDEIYEPAKRRMERIQQEDRSEWKTTDR